MTFDPKEARALVDDLQLVAKCLKGENKFPTGQSVILEAADTIAALLAENERLRERLHRIAQPGRTIAYCQNGHEEAVLIARAALKGADDD